MYEDTGTGSLCLCAPVKLQTNILNSVNVRDRENARKAQMTDGQSIKSAYRGTGPHQLAKITQKLTCGPAMM